MTAEKIDCPKSEQSKSITKDTVNAAELKIINLNNTRGGENMQLFFSIANCVLDLAILIMLIKLGND